MIRILALFFFLIHACFIYACSCGPLPKLSKVAVENAHVIFEGEALKVEFDSLHLTKVITFKIHENLKGVHSGETIEISTNTSGAACGLNVKKGEDWYIFSNYLTDQGQHYASLCGRNTRISKRTYKRKELGRSYRYIKTEYRRKYRRYKKDKRFIRQLQTR